MSSWFEENAQSFSGDFKFNEKLSKHTYYRIGGEARFFATPTTLDDLKWLSEGISETGIRFSILGKGSNTLVSDAGFDGLVVQTSKLNTKIEQISESEIEVGAGVAVSQLIKKACDSGWFGFEFLAGVPGSAGGAVFMNAGTHLGETKDTLTKVSIFDLSSPQSELAHVGKGALDFSYRENHFLNSSSVVYSTRWIIRAGPPREVKAIVDQTLQRRKETQPVEYLSCGSVFRNPIESGRKSWQVLDEVKLRGFRLGGAQFSDKHPNFIVNVDKASAADVRGLIEEAKRRASEQLGINLVEEVRYLGDFSIPYRKE